MQQTAQVTTVQINPPSGGTGFHVEIAWRYGTAGNFIIASPSAQVNQNGTLPVPVIISYDDAINSSIQVRVTYKDALNCTPYYLTYSNGTSVTTTSTAAPSTTTSTTVAPASTTTTTTAGAGSTTTTTTGASTTTTTTAGTSLTAQWTWSATDPFADLQTMDNLTYQGSATFAPGANIVADYHLMPAQQYAVLKVPASEPIKTHWADSGSAFNFGDIPDSIYRSSFVLGAFRYYVTRVPMDFDTNSASRVTFS